MYLTQVCRPTETVWSLIDHQLHGLNTTPCISTHMYVFLCMSVLHFIFLWDELIWYSPLPQNRAWKQKSESQSHEWTNLINVPMFLLLLLWLVKNLLLFLRPLQAKCELSIFHSILFSLSINGWPNSNQKPFSHYSLNFPIVISEVHSEFLNQVSTSTIRDT